MSGATSTTPGRGPVRACAAALLIALCVSHGVMAADDAAGSDKPASGAGFFGRLREGVGSVTGGIGSLLGQMPDKPLIATLQPGGYLKSNEALGDDLDVESKRVRAFGLVAWPEFQGYASPVWQRLKDASGVTGVPGSVYVLPGSELDASSTADANVFVSLGYLRTLKTEDEFAALLAHELSHVLLHHHDSDAVGRMQKRMRDWFASGSLLKNRIERLDQSQQAGNVTLDAGQTRALRKMQLSIQVTEGALQPAWGRRQETEADRLGYDLLVRAGYSGSAMNRFLQAIADFEEEQAKTRAAAQAQFQSGVEVLVQSGKFDDAVGKTTRTAGDQVVEMLGQRHDDAGKRLEALAAYIEKFYPELKRVASKRALYDTRASMQQLLRDYDATFEAMTLIADGAAADALRLLTRVTARGAPIAAHALPNAQMYVALKGLNREKEGVPFLTRSLQAPEPSWDPFKLMGRYGRRQGDPAAVVRAGEAALVRFKQTPALYPELIGFYAAEGQVAKAKEVADLCSAGPVDYRDECARSLQRK